MTYLLLASLSACASTSVDRSNKIHRSISGAFSGIVKKDARSAPYCPTADEGSICLMTWKEAIQYCKSVNAHLPTAREYAALVAARGTSVLEVSDSLGGAPSGYYLVESRNPDGQLDSFYMNHSGYQRPENDTENQHLWTASIPPKHPEYAHVFYNEWGGGGGDPKDHLLTHRNAVQCVFAE